MSKESHKKLVQEATTAIEKIMGDTSVPQSTTTDSLEEIASDIAMRISAMNEDSDE